MSSEQPRKQAIIAIISNAGGSGKTTLASHLAYQLAQYRTEGSRCKVALFDLDPQGSLSLFCGVDKPADWQDSVAVALSDDFSGHWPLVPCWKNRRVDVSLCPSLQQPLIKAANELVTHPRGPYIFGDYLKEEYPLSHDFVILDCPATLGQLSLIALAASTHVLIPIQLEPKSATGAAELLEYYFLECRRLRLKPYPSILGLIPNQYRANQAIHKEILRQLPEVLEQLQLKNARCYPPIRFSYEFSNASGEGLPLHLYRKNHPARKDFKEITSDVANLIGAK